MTGAAFHGFANSKCHGGHQTGVRVSTLAYHAARLAYEPGRTVRASREQHGWSQAQLAAGMTQSAAARFEAGGTVPSLRVLPPFDVLMDRPSVRGGT